MYSRLRQLLEAQRVGAPDPQATPATCPDPLYAQLDIVREPTPTWDDLDGAAGITDGPPCAAVGARVCWCRQTNAGPDVDHMVDAAAAEALRLQVVRDVRPGGPYPCPIETDSAYVVVFVDAAGGSFEVRIAASRCAGIASGDYAAGRAGPDLIAAIEAALS